MLCHPSLGVRDLEQARPIYDTLMATIGWEQEWPGDSKAIGYGRTSGEDRLTEFLLKATWHSQADRQTADVK